MLPQTRRFNDHEFLLVHDGKMEAGEMDRKFGATPAVSLALCHTVVVKTELSRRILISPSTLQPSPLVMSFG